MPEIQRGVMKSKAEQLKALLVGKTISNVSISTGHGDVVRLVLTDSPMATNPLGVPIELAICTMKGTEDYDEAKHGSEAVAVYINSNLVRDIP